MNAATLSQRPAPGANRPLAAPAAADPSSTGAAKAARALIWIYVVLWIVEGALRKWFLVSLSDVLLIIRDPVVIAIYAAALLGKFFPFNLFVVLVSVLAFLSTLAGMAVLPEMPAVVLFGFRANFLHLPLIFVAGRVLTAKDLKWLGVLIVAGAIPQVLIMMKQYRSDPNSWWNLGAGGGKMIEAVQGVIRPAGTFSFISGPVIYFSLAMAMMLGSLLLRRWLKWWMLFPSLGASLMAGAVAGSRSLLLIYVGIGIMFTFGCVLYPRAFKYLLKFFLLGAVAFALVASLSIYREGTKTTTQRAVSANRNEGGLVDVIYSRFAEPIISSFVSAMDTDILGQGLGLGTNGGAALAGRRGKFLVAEDEWTRVLLESGPALGLSFMLTRLFLVLWMLVKALGAARRGNLLALCLWSAGWSAILAGQFGQPTSLGGAVIVGGMLVASLKLKFEDSVFAPQAVPLPTRTEDQIAVATTPVFDQSAPFNVTRKKGEQAPSAATEASSAPRFSVRPARRPQPAPGPSPAEQQPTSDEPAADPPGTPAPAYRPGRFSVHGNGNPSSKK